MLVTRTFWNLSSRNVFFSKPQTDELVLVIRCVYSDERQENQLSDKMEYTALSELTAFVRESNGVWRSSGCVCGLGGGKGRMRSETTQDKETLESRMKRRVYTDRQRERETECRVTESSIFSTGSSFLCSKGRKTMRVIIHCVWPHTV